MEQDKPKTNKERLSILEVGISGIHSKLDTIIVWQSNHMEHHKKLYDRLFKICLVAFGAGLTIGGSLIVSLIIALL